VYPCGARRPMNRLEFQQLAGVRVREAEALLAAGLWDGAYYLAGYAVECALKACIAKLTKAEDFPPKPEIVRDYYTHDINKLVRLAGLNTIRDAAFPKGSAGDLNWEIVKDWNEQSRYERRTQAQAEALVRAITDAADGVLPWIKRHW
jgi:HEPN domain-containing protein